MSAAPLSSSLRFPQFFLALLIVALSYSSAWAEESGASARDWMARMSKALQELNYEGVFVQRSGDQMVAMHVKHLVDEKGEYEYLTTLTGPERRVVRQNRGFGAIPHDDEEGVARYLDGIENNYELSMVGRARVAGWPAVVLVVKPRDQYRYGYRLWLENSTGLLLKSDLMDKDGHVVEQVMFTSMKLLSEEEAAHPPVEAKPSNSSPEEAFAGEEKEQEAWSVGQSIPGFALVDSFEDRHNHVRRLTYSDGLASFSVFVEKAREGEKPFEGISRRGSVSAFGILVDGHQVTVVGEVPEQTVRLVGQSVQFQHGDQ